MDTRSSPESTGKATSPLMALVNETFSVMREAHPLDGRRRLLLHTASKFWHLDKAEQARLAASPAQAHSTNLEDYEDIWDAFSSDAPGLGLLVRTDFTDESAWRAFAGQLKKAEDEIAADDGTTPNSEGQPMDVEDDGDESSDSEDGRPPIFAVIDPKEDDARRALAGVSNLGALRLLCDVDIRRSPPRPSDVKIVNPPNPLIDHGGFQEVYEGKGVWIYDARSNTDRAVRVVSLQGDVYGTATGDSWRARVGHICELQLNMAMGAMKVDFGGLDRWDFAERQRNLQEALAPL